VSIEQDRFDRLRLIRTVNIGPVSYRQLLCRFETATMALAALPDLASNGKGKQFEIASEGEISREFAAVKTLGARHIFLGETDYPALLSHVENAPPAIMAIGNTGLLARDCVAIVGARNASASACRFARSLAHDLADEGFAVISGLARGIDTAAHVGALSGGTVAVLGGGIDIVYPPENGDLHRKIGENGLLIAEQPPGTEPRARHFPYRNRIIAGLSLGTVIVEAAPKSGSLITARLAAEMGREVMAIPGSPLDPRSQGCNQLIREGATLVQCAADIIELLKPLDIRSTRFSPPKQEVYQPSLQLVGQDERNAVASLLGMNFVQVDELARQSGNDIPVVQTVLLELELAGKLERGAGGKVRLM
jgi:DNA processing protein